jgi:hypothetical protein
MVVGELRISFQSNVDPVSRPRKEEAVLFLLFPFGWVRFAKLHRPQPFSFIVFALLLVVDGFARCASNG